MIRVEREERRAPGEGENPRGLPGEGSLAEVVESCHTERGIDILGGRNSVCKDAKAGHNGA